MDKYNVQIYGQNVQKALLNMVYHLGPSKGLKRAIQNIVKEQESLIEFTFSGLHLWQWHDGVFEVPPSLIQFNLSPIEYCLLMKYIKPTEFTRYVENLFSQTFSVKLRNLPDHGYQILLLERSPIVVVCEHQYSIY